MPLIRLLLLLFPVMLQAQLPELIPYRKGNLWGYADSTGIIKIKPQWKYAGLFNEYGLAGVQARQAVTIKDKKYGTYTDTLIYAQVINRAGHYIISYDSIGLLLFQYVKHYEPEAYPDYLNVAYIENYIVITYSETCEIYVDTNGRYVWRADLDDYDDFRISEDPVNMSPASYSYRLNRFPHLRKDKLYFTDRTGHKVSKTYRCLEDWSYVNAFNSYWLFRCVDLRTKDTLVINPHGPAALVGEGKDILFVDTADYVLFRCTESYFMDSARMLITEHPLDNIQHYYYSTTVHPHLKQKFLSLEPKTMYDFYYVDDKGRKYYEP